MKNRNLPNPIFIKLSEINDLDSMNKDHCHLSDRYSPHTPVVVQFKFANKTYANVYQYGKKLEADQIQALVLLYACKTIDEFIEGYSPQITPSSQEIPEMTLDLAEELAMKTDYAVEAVEPENNEINKADAGAFFLEGYEYCRKQGFDLYIEFVEWIQRGMWSKWDKQSVGFLEMDKWYNTANFRSMPTPLSTHELFELFLSKRKK